MHSAKIHLIASILLLSIVPLKSQNIFKVYNVESVTSIQNFVGLDSTIVENDMILTKGYQISGDGGNAKYIVEATNSSIPNGSDIIKISTSLIARLLPEKGLNVKQFGALGNNADYTSQIQQAINYCISMGIPELHFPSGIYRIDETLNVFNPSMFDDNSMPLVTRKAGLQLSGDGVESTIIKALGNLIGPMINIDGIPYSSSYFDGGGISNILFDGSSVGDDTNHGLVFSGWWNATIRNCKFQYFRGDGIRQEVEHIESENPDFTASTNLNFEKVSVIRCGGFGYQNTVLQSAPSFIFNQCLFNLCQKGAAYIQSSSYRFTNCTFAASGWIAEDTTAFLNPSYGIHFGGTSRTANSRHIVEGCEFDNNKDAHIAFSYISNSKFNNNRFIHQYRDSIPNIIPSDKSIIFAPNNENEAIANIEFNSNFFRVYSNPSSSFETLDIFDWAHTSNVFNIYLKMSYIVNNHFTDSLPPHVSINNYIGYDANNNHLINNYVIDNRGPTQENTIVSFGSPSPFYIGSIDPNSPDPNGNSGVFDTLIFDLPDPIFDTGNFENIHYDTDTGIFTCPYSGFYNINVYLTLRNVLKDSQIRFHVKKNNLVVYADYVWGTGNVRLNLDLSTKFFAEANDEISLEIASDGTLFIEPIEVYGFNRLLIELAK